MSSYTLCSSCSPSPLAQQHDGSLGAPRDVPGSTQLPSLPATSTTWQNFTGWASGSPGLLTPTGRWPIYQLTKTEKSCQQKPSDGLSVCEYMDLLSSSCFPLYSNCTVAREAVRATWLRQASKPSDIIFSFEADNWDNWLRFYFSDRRWLIRNCTGHLGKCLAANPHLKFSTQQKWE